MQCKRGHRLVLPPLAATFNSSGAEFPPQSYRLTIDRLVREQGGRLSPSVSRVKAARFAIRLSALERAKTLIINAHP